MDHIEGQTLCAIEREKAFIGKVRKIYIIGLGIFYIAAHFFDAIGWIKRTTAYIPTMTGGVIADLLNMVMLATFFGPLLFAVGYFLRALYFLILIKWDFFKLCLLVVLISLIIGVGACVGNYTVLLIQIF